MSEKDIVTIKNCIEQCEGDPSSKEYFAACDENLGKMNRRGFLNFAGKAFAAAMGATIAGISSAEAGEEGYAVAIMSNHRYTTTVYPKNVSKVCDGLFWGKCHLKMKFANGAVTKVGDHHGFEYESLSNPNWKSDLRRKIKAHQNRHHPRTSSGRSR